MDFTVSAASVGATVDLTVTQDTTAVKNSVKSLVDAVNSTLTQIDSLTAYNPTSKSSGPLAGSSVARAAAHGPARVGLPHRRLRLAGVGVQTDRTGKLVFDEAKFSAAFAADPAAVAAKFTSGAVDGFAARVAAAADGASDKYTGTLTTAITGRTSAISRLEDNIEAWDLRLELRRTSLQQRFTALETALSQMNSQSNVAGRPDQLTVRLIGKLGRAPR